MGMSGFVSPTEVSEYVRTTPHRPQNALKAHTAPTVIDCNNGFIAFFPHTGRSKHISAMRSLLIDCTNHLVNRPSHFCDSLRTLQSNQAFPAIFQTFRRILTGSRVTTWDSHVQKHWFIHRRTSFAFAINNERQQPPHPRPSTEEHDLLVQSTAKVSNPGPHPPSIRVACVGQKQHAFVITRRES